MTWVVIGSGWWSRDWHPTRRPMTTPREQSKHGGAIGREYAMLKNRSVKEAFIFLALTQGLSYLVFWGPLAVFGIPAISFVRSATGPIWAVALFILGGFVPSSVGVYLTWSWEGTVGLRRLLQRCVQFNLGRRGYLATIALVVAATIGKLIVLGALGQPFDPRLFVTQAGSIVPLLVLGPLSEELGWRGFALDRLQTTWSAPVSALVVGLAWGLWHGPLFAMVGTAQHELAVPFLGFVVGLMGQSILYTWLHNHTDGSLWTAIFFHWLMTYAMQVLSTGASRTPLFDWLENVPLLTIAAVVVLLWAPVRPRDLVRT